jgi:predicted phage baseplate assembly protein
MSLPAPNLDDRRFQDLVDEAKRMVQQRCPEWTDHNVSDPGVTLIETFAHMMDQVLYRLNRVPDRHYLKFLDLIGVQPLPPAAAGCDVTFWLSAAREDPVVVSRGTRVATVRSETEEPVVFSTTEELAVVPCQLAAVQVAAAKQRPVDRTEDLVAGTGVECFAQPPARGDVLLFGLSDPAPRCAVLLRLECAVAGVGVDPTDPPLVWEAWTSEGWAQCEVDRDSSGGLNRSGDVVLHLPAGHAASVVGGRRAGWLRCRVTRPAADQPFYQASPLLLRAAASTIGGTARAEHAEVVVDEVVGVSEGAPGQRFRLQRTPVVSGAGGPDAAPLVAEAAEPAGSGSPPPGAGPGNGFAPPSPNGSTGWVRWSEVTSFAGSGPQDRHVQVDRVSGELVFGPAVRLSDGTIRRYGAVPPKGAPIRVPAYRTGGGRRGNVARDTLVVLRDPVPFVSSVTNRRPGAGGVDGEAVRDAAVRGPLLLRTRDRAVTAEDYEQLAHQAAPQAARVRCVAADDGSAGVRVLVVPAAEEVRGQLRFADLSPTDELLAGIAAHLDERRCLGARVLVEPPYYQGITVVAQIRARARSVADAVQQQALAALDGYLHPLRGGPEGTGWPFGRPVQIGEVFAVLQRVSGVDLVEEVRLFGADPITGQRGDPVQRIDLPAHALVYSYGHQIRVVQ